MQEKYCPIHIAERQDKKEKAGDTVKKVGGGLLAFGGLVVTVGKAAIDIAKKK